MSISLEQWDTAFDSQAKAFLVGFARPLPTPEDVGNVAALFCSDQAGWITGQVIYADGGASLMNPEVPPETQLG